MVRPSLQLRRTFRRSCQRFRFWWHTLITDRLFALRDWLAEGPAGADRRFRPLLSILPLENRQMPAASMLWPYGGDTYHKMYTVDDYVTHFGTGAPDLYLGELAGDAGTYYVSIDWGDGAGISVPVTIPSPGGFAEITATHDYDAVGQVLPYDVTTGFHTISITYDTTTFNYPIDIYEGQHLVVSGFGANEGDGHGDVDVQLETGSYSPTRNITVHYQTRDGDNAENRAQAGQDYRSVTGTLTIPAGATSADHFHIGVPIIDDRVIDLDTHEHFYVDFSSPVNADFGDYANEDGSQSPVVTNTVDNTIEDNDTGHVYFHRRLYTTVQPMAGTTITLNVAVDMDIPSQRTVTVIYQTDDPVPPYNSDPPFHKAVPWKVDPPEAYDPADDYKQIHYGTLVFAPFQTKKTFPVAILGKDGPTTDKYFGLILDDVDYYPYANAIEIGFPSPPYSESRDTANVKIINQGTLNAWYIQGVLNGMVNPQVYFIDGVPFLYDQLTGTVFDPITGQMLLTVSQSPCATGPTCGRQVDVQAILNALDNAAGTAASNADSQSTTSILGAPLEFTYNSATVDPLPMFGVTGFTSATGTVPSTIDAALTLDGTTQGTVTYYTTDHSPGDTYFLAVQDSTPVTSSGEHDWSITATAHFLGQDITSTWEGAAGLAVADGGPFGNGWSLDGFDRLVVNQFYAMYQYGNGTTALFEAEPAGAFDSPLGNFGTLQKNDDDTYTYTTPDQTTRNFDADGNLTTVVDRHGLTTTYAYNGGGNLANIFDADGRVATFTYSSGLLQTVQQMGNRTTTFAYDGSGNLTSMTQPDGGVQSFAYDADHRMTGETWGPQRTTFAYDSVTKMLTSEDDGAGVVTQFKSVASTGLVTNPAPWLDSAVASIIDPLGQRTTLTMDRGVDGYWTGLPTTLKTPDGEVRTWERDADTGLVTKYTDPLNRVTSYTYSPGTNDVAQITHPDSSTEAFQYDSTFHQLTKYTDTLNRTTTITLTTQGDVATVKDPLNDVTTFTWANGRIATTIDANNHTTTYLYDSLLRLQTVVDPLGGRTTYGYDPAWNLTTVTDANNHTVTTLYDPMRRLVQQVDAEGGTTTYTYNAPGWRTGMIDAAGARTSFGYDPAGRLTTVTEAVGTGLTRTTTLAYDYNGRETAQTDPLNHTTSFGYDAVGRTKWVKDALNNVTSFNYDAVGNLLSTANPLNHTTTFAYNSRDWQTGMTDATGRRVTIAYDTEGNVIQVTTPRDGGAVTASYAYDALNRVTRLTEAVGLSEQRTTSVAYDAVGNVLSATDPLNHTSSYAYDALDRATRVIEAYGTGLQRTTTIAYDAAGNVLSILSPRGTTTSLGYDKADRPTQLIEAYANMTLARTTTTAYDGLGRVTAVTDPLGVQSTYAYDVLGRLTGMTAAAGTGVIQRTAYGYDLNDNPTSITDPLSHTTTAVYDSLNRLVQTIDPLGHTATTVYDPDGDVVQTIDVRGTITSYSHDALGRVALFVEAYGTGLARTTTVAYDLAGNLLSATDSAGHTTSFAYDALGRATATIEAFGVGGLQRTTTTAFDAADNVLRVTDPLAHVTSYAYDELGRPTTTTEAVGASVQRTTTVAYDAGDLILGTTDALGVHTTFEYDALGRPISQTDAAGDSLHRTTSFAYDVRDQLLSTTDPLGHTTSYAYDAIGRTTAVIEALGVGGLQRTTTIAYDAANNALTVTDPLNHTTTYAYDALNRLKAATDPLNHTTTIAYDAGGNALTVTDPLNHTTTFAYDELGRRKTATDALNQTTTYQYDAVDNQIGVIDPRGNHGTLAYDALNRLIAQTDPLNHTTTTVYDAADNVVRTIDALGNATTYTYDELNRRVTMKDADGGTTTTLYDKLDHVVGTIDPLNHRTTAVFDTLGRATQTIDALTGVTTLQYDAADRLTGLTDPGNNHTTFAYDALNQQTSMTDPLNHTATYAYDAAGRLTGTTNRDGQRRAFGYDNANRLTGETRYAVGGGVQDVLTFAYDAADNQTLAQNGAGAYTLTYDAANQVSHVTEPFGFGLTFTYDAAGNRTKVQDSLGGVMTSVYDTADRLTSRQFSASSGVLRFDTAYTVRNQISAVTRYSNLAGTTQVGLSSMTYDPAGRETARQHFNGSNSLFQNTTYTYDLAGRMTAEQLNGSTTSYSYDVANQLTAAGTATFAYDASGNRTSGGATPSAGNQISQDSSATYAYDADGNRTGQTSKVDASYWQYDYNAADQLTAARDYDHTGALQTAVTYLYDAWDNLIERDLYQGLSGAGDNVIGGGGETDLGAFGAGVTVTRYAQDGWKVSQDFWGNRQQPVGLSNFDVWAEFDATSGTNTLTVRRFYGDGVDTPTARINYVSGTGTAAWYFTDVRDSVTAVANSSGTVKATITYDGYGNATVGGADTTYADAYRYTGRPLDAATNLQNNRGRWFDPRTGTFTAQDPMGFAARDYNLSRYVGNGPTNATDPSGRELQFLHYGDNLEKILVFDKANHFIGQIVEINGELYVLRNGVVVRLADVQDKNRTNEEWGVWIKANGVAHNQDTHRQHIIKETEGYAKIEVVDHGRTDACNVPGSTVKDRHFAGGMAATTVIALLTHVGISVAIDGASFVIPFEKFAAYALKKGYHVVKKGGRLLIFDLKTGTSVAKREAEGVIVAAAEEFHPHAASLKPYGGPGGGHHVPAKSAFAGAKGYDPLTALAIPNEELARLGVKHFELVTPAQRRLYTEFAKTGEPLTWEVIERIEAQALVDGGMNSAVARATVGKATRALKDAGVCAPTRIPWNGK